ncbi:MAG: AAA family ATPase [Bifidobacteriaceae bacterium]|jgi:predicted AAA+ superfamily ATPase|nr:AAA family ATPase [Bifidobacteriaceae bacterium]
MDVSTFWFQQNNSSCSGRVLAQARSFHDDPDQALAVFEHPLLLDEWQEVPTVLGAVKRSVDANQHRGQFLLTGSVRADLTGESWPATGRVAMLTMTPLVQREIS